MSSRSSVSRSVSSSSQQVVSGSGSFSQEVSYSSSSVAQSSGAAKLSISESSHVSGFATGSSNAVGQIASDLLAINAGRKSASSGSYQQTSSSSSSSQHFSASSTASASSASASAGSMTILSEVEQAILRSNIPIEINETEELTVNFAGKQETGVWSNRGEVINWKGIIPITEYILNEDMNPEVITKRTEQQLVYIQELAIRYLRPPTPPAPGEILIQQEVNTLTPPAPPLVIRQMPARASTPEPLVIREAPPQPPAAVGRKVITISGKRIPPPPRKVVIERLAPLPSKPQSVLVERWLPYSQVKRRVIFQRSNERDAVVVKPRNVIVQWEAPQVVIKKEFKYLGVIRANPVEYVQRYGATLKMAKELPDFVLDIKTPEGLVLAADYKYNAVHELEGDVKALGFVDLDREGLGEYRSYLSGLGVNYVGAAGAIAAASQYQSSGFTASSSSNVAAITSGATLSNSFAATNGATLSGSFAAGNAATISGSFSASSAAAVAKRDSFSTSANLVSSGNAATSISRSVSVAKSTSHVSEDVIAEIFRSIDTDNSGSISTAEASTVLLRLNSRLHRSYGEDEAIAFFKVLDTDHNGQLTLEQFRHAFDRITL